MKKLKAILEKRDMLKAYIINLCSSATYALIAYLIKRLLMR